MEPMEEIYQMHAGTVYRYLLTLSGDADTAEELTQETFYQAVKSLNRYDGSCKVTTWLCAIAKNQYLAWWRKHPSAEPLETALANEYSAQPDLLHRVEYLELLQRMHALEDPVREVLYLRLFGELSFREIGTVLHRTENWARVTYYRGKERLRKELESDE